MRYHITSLGSQEGSHMHTHTHMNTGDLLEALGVGQLMNDGDDDDDADAVSDEEHMQHIDMVSHTTHNTHTHTQHTQSLLCFAFCSLFYCALSFRGLLFIYFM